MGVQHSRIMPDELAVRAATIRARPYFLPPTQAATYSPVRCTPKVLERSLNCDVDLHHRARSLASRRFRESRTDVRRPRVRPLLCSLGGRTMADLPSRIHADACDRPRLGRPQMAGVPASSSTKATALARRTARASLVEALTRVSMKASHALAAFFDRSVDPERSAVHDLARLSAGRELCTRPVRRLEFGVVDLGRSLGLSMPQLTVVARSLSTNQKSVTPIR
jgi:hypothetical protein